MAVRTKEEIIASLQALAGENITDEVVALVEDIADTMDSVGTPPVDNEWEQRYNDLDKQWKEKYLARFSEGTTKPVEETVQVKEEETEESPQNFDDLFTESEGK